MIADVTGKGLDAALLMAFARPVMHSALDAARGPAEAIERTNRVLVGERRGTLFISVLAAVLQPTTGRLRIASAGHEAPFLVPGDGGPIRAVGDVGVLMGAFATIRPPETELAVAPGDALLYYTDGVTDAVSPIGRALRRRAPPRRPRGRPVRLGDRAGGGGARGGRRVPAGRGAGGRPHDRRGRPSAPAG